MGFKKKRLSSELRTHGFKLTPQRLAILNIIDSSHDHLTPAAIYDRVHKENPHIGVVTIYRTLSLLNEIGLICEVHTDGSCRSYLLKRNREHHHHLICSMCGEVVDFTECDLNRLEKRLSRTTGFEINSHLLEFSGSCRNCRK